MMVPLETNRRVLTWLSVFPPEEGSTKSQKVAYTAFTLWILGVLVFSFVTSLAYFLKYMHRDFGRSLFVMVQITGVSNMFYIVCITFILRHRITAVYISLCGIYKARKNTG